MRIQETGHVAYRQVISGDEIQQILALQKINLPAALDEGQQRSDGFLTIEHDAEILWRMNNPFNHVVAMDRGVVVGYCLVMTVDHAQTFPVVEDMFTQLETMTFGGQPLNKQTYFIMGQVCVEKKYRGTGVFKGLYDKLRQTLSRHFKYCITEVSRHNPRSLRAHLKVGFEVLLSYEDNTGHPWELIIWDWRE